MKADFQCVVSTNIKEEAAWEFRGHSLLCLWKCLIAFVLSCRTVGNEWRDWSKSLMQALKGCGGMRAPKHVMPTQEKATKQKSVITL